MEIARAAAGLFARHGLRATRAEDIAQAAGIAPRTFYRYFASKEEAVAPLYAAGAQRWAEAVREAPAGLSVPEALDHAVRHTLSPGGGVSAASWEWVRTLIRLATTSPPLRKVWAEVCQEAEDTLAGVLVERDGAGDREAGGSGAFGSEAGGGGGGNRGAGDREGNDREGDDHEAGDREAQGADNVADGPGASPDLRFTAAVASAAVRVAVESWATGDAPATGPDGPAALALRNLAALRDFRWERRP
ncbi:TetR family transcriptional regulator [Streptomyces pharetrae CZA14]|uniref:TetR family transcriptional regulator n=2 Tax=Streptomyces pharetrae TaxID=291370 RepID=A0ABX3YN82_9ACTN|nr:TetR family transcriptional regulator [Streptomyces pharetrae CZA14]